MRQPGPAYKTEHCFTHNASSSQHNTSRKDVNCAYTSPHTVTTTPHIQACPHVLIDPLTQPKTEVKGESQKMRVSPSVCSQV